MILRRTQLLFSLAAALLLQNAAHANDIEPGAEFYTAIKTSNPIVLDGDLSEWTSAAITNPQFSIPKGSGSDPNVAGEFASFESLGGDWTGPDDHSSSLHVTFDDDNVYLGLIVTDDYHENSANSPWNGDSVQMMIANEARDTQIALYNYAIGGVEGALGDIIIDHEAGPGGTNAIVTRNADTKQTTYEVMMPKAALALGELTSGTQFGLGMAINDGDELTPGQMGWSGLGAHAIVFGKSPSETALITLAVPEPGSLGLCLIAVGGLLRLRRKSSR